MSFSNVDAVRCCWINASSERCGAVPADETRAGWASFHDCLHYCPQHAAKGSRKGPEPLIGEKFVRLAAIPVSISDPELREDIMNFELTTQLTEAHIARILELAVRGLAEEVA